jgi:hypothetical protein
MGMKDFTDRVERDLEKGIALEDCLRRLGGALDAWLDERIGQIETRLERLETVSKVDKQTITEVDGSVRQTWEALDARLKVLEDPKAPKTHQLGQ